MNGSSENHPYCPDCDSFHEESAVCLKPEPLPRPVCPGCEREIGDRQAFAVRRNRLYHSACAKRLDKGERSAA